jgi:hypothetical protein
MEGESLLDILIWEVVSLLEILIWVHYKGMWIKIKIIKNVEGHPS